MRTIFTFLILLTIATAFAQTNNKLDLDNGFRNIHLMADVDSVPDFISIFKDPDINNQKYEYAMLGSQYSYHGKKDTAFGNAAIRKIFLATTKGLISEIRVICDHDSSVISLLTGMYGPPVIPLKTVPSEDKKSLWTISFWQADNVRLAYTAKKDLKKKDADEPERPDFIYLKYTSLEADELMYQK
jgi:hypothetical protein